MSDKEQKSEQDLQFDGWLTAIEAAAVLDVTVATITRLASQGILQREKVGAVYLYEPSCVQARLARQQALAIQPPTPAASSPSPSETSGASTIAAGAGLVRALSTLTVDLVDRVLESSRVQDGVSQALLDRSIKMLERLEDRCSRLETAHTEALAAREAFLDGTAERELQVFEKTSSNARKDEVLKQLTEHGPAMLKLLELMLTPDPDSEEPAQPAAEETEKTD